MTAVRRLAAILAVDVVGYSRLTGEDEAGTHQVKTLAARWNRGPANRPVDRQSTSPGSAPTRRNKS
jgi:class 3 adenylate cyclase